MKHTFLLLFLFLSLGGCSSDESASSSFGGSDANGAPNFDQGLDPASGQMPPSGDVQSCKTNPATGCPCEVGSDCLSGYCLTTGDGLACSETCEADQCPPDWSCQLLPEDYCPGCPPLCVPQGVYLCRPCLTDGDCFSPYNSVSPPRCLAYGDEGNFCGVGCETDEHCPQGSSCETALSAGGVESKQCVPDSGTCECSQLATDEGAVTSCTVAGAGTGCAGTRSCGPNGLTDCTPVTALETCDGKDNDCDGAVDESTCSGGETCLCTDDTCVCGTEGSCIEGSTQPCDSDCGEGLQTCTDGAFGPCTTPESILCMDYATCTQLPTCGETCPAAPAEACNQSDDNCDGTVDEGFACTVGQSESQDCDGGCGQQTRICLADCTWGPWTGCNGGTCVPGESQTQTSTCGSCGEQSQTRTCGDVCEWGPWSAWSACSGQGVCTPGQTESCSDCTERSCTNSCEWTSCNLNVGATCAWEQGTNFECCGFGEWHFCSAECQWYPCQGCDGNASCESVCE